MKDDDDDNDSLESLVSGYHQADIDDRNAGCDRPDTHVPTQ